MRYTAAVALLCSLTLLACDPPPPELDAGATDAGGACTTAAQCDDGDSCNGAESCEPGAAGADARGCVSGTAMCDPALEMCEAGQCVPRSCDEPDRDGDGHDSIACGGDDCDDDDVDRYPGNPEVCDASHDEDCLPNTVGDTDEDGDGEIARTCCNGEVCGSDCDDSARERFSGATEICNTVDDDCDGEVDGPGAFCPAGSCVNQRCRALSWERVYSGPTFDRPEAVALDASGNVYFTMGGGPLDLNDEPNDAEQPFGWYLVSLSPLGRARWFAPLPSNAYDLAVDPGGAYVAASRGRDVLLFSSSTGADVGSVELPVPAEWEMLDVRGIVSRPEGLFVAASLQRTVNLKLAQEEWALHLMHLGPDASVIATRTSAVQESDVSVGAIVGTEGRLLLAGAFFGELVFPEGTVPTGSALVEFDLDLQLVRSVPTGSFTLRDIAIARDGRIAFVGSYGGSPELLGVTLPSSTANDGLIFVVNPDGTYAWHRTQNGPQSDSFTSVSFDERGGVLVAGQFSGEIDVTPFGRWVAGPAQGNADGVIAVFDELDGFPLDARRITGPGVESIDAASADPFGAYVIAGQFSLDVGLLLGEYTASGSSDAFVIRMAD